MAAYPFYASILRLTSAAPVGTRCCTRSSRVSRTTSKGCGCETMRKLAGSGLAYVSAIAHVIRLDPVPFNQTL